MISKILTLILLSMSLNHAYADDDDLRSPTIYLDIGSGLSTYKSKLVTSNDTGFTTGYTLGMNGSQNNYVGAQLRNDSNTTNFEYGVNDTNSKIISNFQDFVLLFRLGFFYLGAVFSQSQIKVNRYDVDYLDLLGTGYGGNVGFSFLLGKRASIFLDVVTASSGQVKESIQGTEVPTGIGSRTDIFAGGSIQLTKSLLDFTIGIKQRSYSLSVADESFNELLSTTWLGLGIKDSF